MKVYHTIIIALLLLCCSLGVKAQVTVEQSVDSVGIYIGQQAHLTLAVTLPENAHLQWPAVKERQYLVPGLEVDAISQPDTTKEDNHLMKVTRVYTITSFDEHLYAIPPMTVHVNGKPYKGSTAALKVITVDVDTVHPNQMYPPKDVQDNPFQWSEWSPYFWLSILVVGLLLLGYYLFIRLRDNKPIITTIHIVRHIPPHQRALKAIDKIKSERMAQSEDQKHYYTQLTETLRRYIEERFGFNAMEMTSTEIIEHLERNADRKMLDELRELFRTADLVKFAKYQVQLNENDLNLVNAINFIDETKTDQQPTEEKVVPQLSADDQRTRTNRIAIKTLLWVIGVGSLLLLAYIIYSMYQLMS